VGYLDIVLRAVWIFMFPCHVRSLASHVELYRGKSPNLY
jgi:hypothetical protein